MRVLVACEFSGAVRSAFRVRGHEAWSCDYRPAEDGSPYHIQADAYHTLMTDPRGYYAASKYWDMLIAFPPCTDLCSAGAATWKQKQKDGRQQRAIEFVLKLANTVCVPKIAIENPVGILSSRWRKPDQIIQPFQFGDPYYKTTCLWLKNLPLLKPTNEVEPIAHWHGGVRRGGVKKDGTRTKSKLPTALKYGEKERSRTFQGIAKAMAEQWGAAAPPEAEQEERPK